jgi:hypothetical protein
LVGPCDACSRLTELFQLPGRKDSNCAQCNADIATLVLLYGGLTIAQRGGENVAELPSQRIFLSAASTADEERGHDLPNTTSSDEKPSDEIAVVKSA